MAIPAQRQIPPDPDESATTGRPATDEAIVFLRRGILSGSLPPRGRLNASQIANDLGMTIVPVREAIHFLAGEGMIELLALKGARVRSFDREEIIGWWRIYQALTEIELRSVAEKVVKYPSNQSLITAALAEIESTNPVKHPRRFLNSLADFHGALNRVSGEAVVREASRRLQVRFWTSFLVTYVPLDVYGSQFAKHYAIVADAVRRGDGASAVASFAHHVAWSSALIRGERPTPGEPWSPLPR